ncbi:hypothetical protein COY90_04640 [Candidatus Roizmanbacteria bacterium CG_4_10_14_0_8_um_filter_39_9]|uniref:Double zinc ribbon domain-containing protein n=1 Tax=Candidatus Roizmanbacteria bacterium CG_4_10_14_0_8_um_filter_39_9 TaxID=1974829 RepID=A0A2M7QBR4_9BACT|nr:MAG: hypothetical protein COY90_04640 [Candidatus Roizmanbacteria bacterium CG_4_10_14_0_8_um_filter_39_9]
MSFSDVLFPRFCLGCGATGSFICVRCEGLLSPFEINTCFYCGSPSLNGLSHPRCRRPKGVDGFISLYHYNNLFKKIIKSIKYNKAKIILGDLNHLLGKNLLKTPIYYYVKKFPGLVAIPVPLFEARQKQRGFNQTEPICTYVSGLLSIGQNTNTLVRIKDTPMQTLALTKKQRRENIQGAFYGGSPPPHILLIDDVVTTGATTKEAAKTLKENGAKTVVVFSVAKG